MSSGYSMRMHSKKTKRELRELSLSILVISLISLGLMMMSLTCMVDLSRPILSGSSCNASCPARIKEQRLPQAIIIGTRKSGTRAVAKFLEVNPSIRSANEEVHFFDRAENYRLGLEWYRKQMPSTDENQLTIEKSPAYFVTRGVPELIKAMNASIKLIVVMRNPVTRLISDFSQLLIKRNLDEHEQEGQVKNSTARVDHEGELERLITRPDGGIDEQKRLIRTGMYTAHLERWLTVFSRHQFHFVDGERLIEEPHKELQKIETFLGYEQPSIRSDHFEFNMEKGFYCLVGDPFRRESIRLNKTAESGKRAMKCLGKSKGRSHIPISQRLRDKLEAFYAPYNEYLYALTGLNFV